MYGPFKCQNGTENKQPRWNANPNECRLSNVGFSVPVVALFQIPIALFCPR